MYKLQLSKENLVIWAPGCAAGQPRPRGGFRAWRFFCRSRQAEIGSLDAPLRFFQGNLINNPEAILKKYLGAVGILFSVVFIGMVLVSVGVRVLPLAGARLLGQGKSVMQGFHVVSAFVQLAMPRLAVYVADALLVLLIALGLLFIHMLVMVPVHLHRLHGQVKSLEEQVSLLRLELFTQVNGLAVSAVSPPRRALEEEGMITTRSSPSPRPAA